MTYEDILEDVRNIIRNKAPEDSVLELIEEIDQLKDKIRTQVLDKEHETHFEGMYHSGDNQLKLKWPHKEPPDFEGLPLDFTMEALSIGKTWIKQNKKKNNK